MLGVRDKEKNYIHCLKVQRYRDAFKSKEVMLLEKETYPSWLVRIPLHKPLGSSLEVGVMYVAHPKWVVHY